ncbi:MAG: polysaccharide pyruvyl transferase family protein [Paenibacillus dendritiformis]|uniref:polysaccharide pyruvyl transferase family protein n=1 Tax=uncultured Paenibacillus sp. TaxID=227322 RepID=UPI0025CF8F68|nr:polysaccharide pyruvyl transferase family protein [uncultured Paenibacillus sp.]MDU5143886.1 polysaccharide pyruvyl transferase family protein [Paenibacillus dendritiformis]
MTKILYLGEIGYQNAGDQVMWDVFRQHFNKHLDASRFHVAGSLANAADPLAFDAVVLGGGSLISPLYLSKLEAAFKGSTPYYIWGSGVDKLVPKHILDAMLNSAPPPAGLIVPSIQGDIFRNARYAAVRGPLSQAFLQMAGVPAESIAVSGDPALLLTPGEAKPVTHDPPLPGDRPCIGINWGTARNEIFGNDEASVEDKLVTAAKEWIRQGYSILLFAMWPNDIPANRQLMQKIGFENRVHLYETVNPYELMSIIGQCKFTVDFKLHAAVLSAVMRVPFIALGYRFKVYDFAASIDAIRYVVSTDSSTLGYELMHLSSLIEENYSETVAALDQRVVHYQKMNMLAEPFFERLKKEVETK